ncbi:MAG: hypothetical protein FJW34_24655, partial [Acidobacteria bacterium]|nr:hypothetical protein [Acidobacteriota bacterium]
MGEFRALSKAGLRLRDKLAADAVRTKGLLPPLPSIEAAAQAGETLEEVVGRRSWNSQHFLVRDADGQPTGHRAFIRAKSIHYEPGGPGSGGWVAEGVAGRAEYPGEAIDGYIEGMDPSYATARSTSSACDTGSNVGLVGQGLSQYTGDPFVDRSFLSFDTSVVPAGTILEGVLYVCADDDFSDTDFNVQVYRYAWQEPLADYREANYDGAYGGSAVLEGTLRNTADGWVAGTYYSLSLAVEGINRAGDTRYTLVSSRDVAGNAPAGVDEVVWIRTADYAGTSSDPFLCISVSIPSEAEALTITVGGTNYTAYATWLGGGCSIEKSTQDMVGTATFTFRALEDAHKTVLNNIAGGQSVVVTNSAGTRRFAGTVKELKRSVEVASPIMFYTISCTGAQGSTPTLRSAVISSSHTFTAQTDQAIIQHLGAEFAATYDWSTYVGSKGAIASITFYKDD